MIPKSILIIMIIVPNNNVNILLFYMVIYLGMYISSKIHHENYCLMFTYNSYRNIEHKL